MLLTLKLLKTMKYTLKLLKLAMVKPLNAAQVFPSQDHAAESDDAPEAALVHGPESAEVESAEAQTVHFVQAVAIMF
jgi:hypothetical protein